MEEKEQAILALAKRSEELFNDIYDNIDEDCADEVAKLVDYLIEELFFAWFPQYSDIRQGENNPYKVLIEKGL